MINRGKNKIVALITLFSVFIYIHICVCVYMYIYIYMCIYKYVYIYIRGGHRLIFLI